MAMLNDQVREQVKRELAVLKNPVKLVNFTQEIECEYCRETRSLVEEVASLSNKVSAEVYNLVLDKEKAAQYKIDKIPAIAVVGEKDYGIRFFGIPAGYEFTSLIEAIKTVGNGDSGLSDAAKKQLATLTQPVHIQVFVTVTCPYCPAAVRLAHKMAFESDLVTADMVESMEFPHLANKYDVFSVPKVVINETRSFEGALPEMEFVKRVVG